MEGERSGLFFEIVRLLRETGPRFCFLENVPAITTRGGVQVVKEITSLGYDCRWCVISAASVGALHKRERWFLLANSKCKRFSKSEFQERSRPQKEIFEGSCALCDDDSQPSEQTHSNSKPYEAERNAWGGSARQYWPFESREHWQKTVSEMGKCSHGIPNHVARLRALGNSVVPAQVKKAFCILSGIEYV